MPLVNPTVVAAGSVTNASVATSAAIEQGKLKNLAAPVTALPASPVDGDMCVFQADATNGVYWLLRYRAGSASAYKWECVGGGPLVAEIDTSEATASTTYADLATVGPSLTVPLAGDYVISFGFRGSNNTAGFWSLASFAVGAAAAADADSCVHVSASANARSSVERSRKKAAVAAASAIVMKYSADGNTATFVYRFLQVLPIRVG